MTTLEKLITSWLENPPTERSRLRYLNIQLWKAVADDHMEKSRIGIITSPTQDPKVKFAVMFLEKLNGERKSICPHIEAAARFVLHLPIPEDEPQTEHPTHPTGKSAAANDR
jgi:hypothetical protein